MDFWILTGGFPKLRSTLWDIWKNTMKICIFFFFKETIQTSAFLFKMPDCQNSFPLVLLKGKGPEESVADNCWWCTSGACASPLSVTNHLHFNLISQDQLFRKTPALGSVVAVHTCCADVMSTTSRAKWSDSLSHLLCSVVRMEIVLKSNQNFQWVVKDLRYVEINGEVTKN